MFAYIAPSPALRGFVRDYLIAHFVPTTATPAPVKPYAPKPEQGMTFFIRERPFMVSPLTGEIHQAPPVSIFGQQVVRCDIHLPAEFLMFRVHFQPGTLFCALNTPLHLITGAYFDAELVLSREVREVSDQLADARNYAGMVAAVETYLLRAMARAKRDRHLVDWAACRLMTDPQHVSLDSLAAEVGIGVRQFNRKFTERLGVGPKLYSRLARFHRTIRYKEAHPSIAWPTVALDFGYSDYQHMVRDFRLFTNTTPTAWLLEEAASPEHTLATPDSN